MWHFGTGNLAFATSLGSVSSSIPTAVDFIMHGM